MIKWFLLAGAVVAELVGALTFKYALSHPAYLIIVATGFTAALLLLAEVLRRGVPLGVAYGLWGAAGVAITTMFSTVLYDEPLTPGLVVGITLIVAGVLAVEIGSHAAERAAIDAEPAAIEEAER
ncbi:DMT family transporter [Rhodococcoides yunnanense]|uniref:SMR family transporter n=1 Tax=Rhodococcoides yunnanense TaxID=278209 RepID=A0ABU4BIT1_9NOCA|nr:SMR family transporter [Rhodococcus yunnanensis]MDV6263979.1 SMR family transporter [Rhodococcus yunnanensis]